MTAGAHGGADADGAGEHPSPWFRAAPPGDGGIPEPAPAAPAPAVPEPAPAAPAPAAPAPAPAAPAPAVPAQTDDETIALRTADTRRAVATGPPGVPLPPEAVVPPDAAVPGGRAARRKAARHKGRRGVKPGTGAGSGAGRRVGAGAAADPQGRPEHPEGQGDPGRPERPLTRVEARRAARAAKPGPATVASRAIGEVFITIGVLMLLFVTYQLWWTNIRAQQQADAAARKLQEDWAEGKGKPGVFEPGQGFALMHIPKLDVVVPVAEGIDKHRVLDRGMVGHYNKGGTKTPMPEANPGNFAVAGHRNTHGEPFRYINRLKPGDPIVVETQDTYFVYKMASILPQTSPANTAVLDAVPPGSGFTRPGRYLTLTTCTPEFTSKYRLIVWGKMVEERPRAKGKPPALVD
ncbi:class E sortase [Streptomyces silvensis]|uniref:class E sortase n=1 Tax=Streptomyces silvensis TaxID=1765722 RepID=UPI000B21E227|nr:class E sortase [Streptomyces silvensis]